MPAISCSAPGKVILCGEHAVVYGRPAIAIPVFKVASTCRIIARPTATSNDIIINAPKIGLKTELDKLSDTHPIRKTIEIVLESLKFKHLPSCEILINSSIPTAAGMGSSASTSVALIRAVSTFLGHPFESSEINRIAFEIEKFHHGSPSGIDNTVITYAKPLYFVRNSPYQFLSIKKGFSLLIADSGISSSTGKVVNEVKAGWEKEPAKYEGYFNEIQSICNAIRGCLESGETDALGELLNNNHRLLIEMGVSCPKLDHLVKTALENGAEGAKLSGGGQGGNMIALVSSENQERIAHALQQAGAVNTIFTQIPAEGDLLE